MSHLTSDELVDALDGALASTRQPHLDVCADCRGRVAELAAVATAARSIEVPEPSPLFWERFSERLRVEIAAGVPDDRRPHWLAWPVLAPLAGLALVVLALGGLVSREGLAPAATLLVRSEPAETDVGVEAAWALASDLMGAMNVADDQEAGLLVGPGSAERAALHLTTDEQVELVRLLRQELGRSGG